MMLFEKVIDKLIERNIESSKQNEGTDIEIIYLKFVAELNTIKSFARGEIEQREENIREDEYFKAFRKITNRKKSLNSKP